MNMLMFTTIGVLLEGLALYAFIAVTQTVWATPGKQVLITMFVVFIVTLLFAAARVFNPYKLLQLAVFLGLAFILLYQVVGFALYPGLVKDITPFSLEHFKTTFLFSSVVFGCYAVAVSLVLVAKQIIENRHSR